MVIIGQQDPSHVLLGLLDRVSLVLCVLEDRIERLFVPLLLEKALIIQFASLI